jgi:hypothetical protein
VAIVVARPTPRAISGKVFTTDSTGTTVNGNLYLAKADVYIGGGPQEGNPNGLPDGDYYFQITNPSGTELYTTDSIECRRVEAVDGVIAGVSLAGGCATPRAEGTTNPTTGATPVQLIPYLDTTNPGGVYKVWLTRVEDYDTSAPICAGAFGFCNSDAKTDNFTVTIPTAAFVTVCKFNDLNGNGTRDAGEPLIPHWPITATGVDGGPSLDTQTGDDGCVALSVSGFTTANPTKVVTLTEGTIGPDWTRTAPADGDYDGGFSVTGGVISVTVEPGDNLTAPYFGNTNPFCDADCQLDELVVTKDAFPKLTRTYTWTIDKTVDDDEVHQSDPSHEFEYTVTVTHDDGVDSGWTVTGTITVANPGSPAVTVDVTDELPDASCIVDNGTNVEIPAGGHEEFTYTCTFASEPPPTSTNTAKVSSGEEGTATVDFTTADITRIHDTVNVSDTLKGSLGSVSYTDPSPKEFTYKLELQGTAGTCTTRDNTASFASEADVPATGEDKETVTLCVGADLTVSKTATPSFKRTYLWSISKGATPLTTTTSNPTAIVNYTVNVNQTGVTDSEWAVTGTITVTNPNDWQDITADLADAIDNGGNCTVTAGNDVLVPMSGFVTRNYSCTYASAPSPAAFTNKATATWDKTDETGASTPNGSADGTSGGSFGAPTTTVNKTIHVTDTLPPGAPTALATLTGVDVVPFTSAMFSYSRTLPNSTTPGACLSYTNTATITETGQTSSKTVQVCNPAPPPCTDAIAPTIVVAGTALNPSRVYFSVRDNTGGSGIQTLQIIAQTNATITWPPFAPPYTGTITVTATKINASQTSIVGLRATDRCGNVTLFDPADVSVNTGKREAVTVTDLWDDENTVKIVNEGVKNIRLTVNTTVFDVVNLGSKETRFLDIGAALKPGTDNTITIEARGPAGGHAVVYVYPGGVTAQSGTQQRVRGHKYVIFEPKD